MTLFNFYFSFSFLPDGFLHLSSGLVTWSQLLVFFVTVMSLFFFWWFNWFKFLKVFLLHIKVALMARGKMRIINFFKSSCNHWNDGCAILVKIRTCELKNIWAVGYEVSRVLLPVFNAISFLLLCYFFFFVGTISDIGFARRLAKFLLIVMPLVNVIFLEKSVRAPLVSFFDLWTVKCYTNTQRLTLLYCFTITVFFTGLWFVYNQPRWFVIIYVITWLVLIFFFMVRLGRRLLELDSLREFMTTIRDRGGYYSHAKLNGGFLKKGMFLILKRSVLGGLQRLWDDFMEPRTPRLTVDHPKTNNDTTSLLRENLRNRDFCKQMLAKGHALSENEKQLATMEADRLDAEVQRFQKIKKENLGPKADKAVDLKIEACLDHMADAIQLSKPASQFDMPKPVVKVELGHSLGQKVAQVAKATVHEAGRTGSDLIAGGVPGLGRVGKVIVAGAVVAEVVSQASGNEPFFDAMGALKKIRGEISNPPHSVIEADARRTDTTKLALANLELEKAKVDLQSKQVDLQSKQVDLQSKQVDAEIKKTNSSGWFLWPK